MADGVESLTYPCSLKPDVASRVQALLQKQFPTLEVTIYPDRSVYSPSQAAKIPESERLVIFGIPRGINMVNFWEQLSRSESVASTQKESVG